TFLIPDPTFKLWFICKLASLLIAMVYNSSFPTLQIAEGLEVEVGQCLQKQLEVNVNEQVIRSTGCLQIKKHEYTIQD
ncbi:hypothetical protein ACJX0J_031805, partial [Zea mays]